MVSTVAKTAKVLDLERTFLDTDASSYITGLINDQWAGDQ